MGSVQGTYEEPTKARFSVDPRATGATLDDLFMNDPCATYAPGLPGSGKD
jgi:hypothetical protein